MSRTRRPAHAQPGALASLRWASALESAVGTAALLALVVTAVAGGSGTNPAAAVAPVPPSTRQATPAAVNLGWTLNTPPSSTGPSSIPLPSPASTAATPLPTDLAAASALAADGIPLTALQAYQSAAVQENLLDPGCRLPWPLLAAIGRVESDHGRFAGAVLHTDGLSTPRVIGIPLDGHGTALIRDTDRGRLDGDTVYDRAVGPMQFIPSTWAGYRADGNGDGVTDPFNIFDAAAAAAHYLCTAGGDLATPKGQQRAVLAYNHSAAYLAEVLDLEAVYAGGVPGVSVPVVPTGPPPPVPTDIPPVNPAPPPSATTTSPAPPSSGSSGPTSSGPSTPGDGSGGTVGSSTDPSSSASAGCSQSPSGTGTPSGTPSTGTPSTGTSSSGTSSSADTTSSPPATDTPDSSTTSSPAPSGASSTSPTASCGSTTVEAGGSSSPSSSP